MKKFTKILSFAMLTLTLSSCLKDKGYEDNKYGINDSLEDIKVINMPVTGTTFTTAVTAAITKTTANTVTIPIHLSAKDPATEDINVTIATDDARLTTYNTANPTTTYTRLPNDKFTLSNGGVVKIASGSRDAAPSLVVSFTPSTFTAAGRWAIPIAIKSVDKSGYVISGNQVYRLILITITP
jgi:hypothetical protein